MGQYRSTRNTVKECALWIVKELVAMFQSIASECSVVLTDDVCEKVLAKHPEVADEFSLYKLASDLIAEAAAGNTYTTISEALLNPPILTGAGTDWPVWWVKNGTCEFSEECPNYIKLVESMFYVLNAGGVGTENDAKDERKSYMYAGLRNVIQYATLSGEQRLAAVNVIGSKESFCSYTWEDFTQCLEGLYSVIGEDAFLLKPSFFNQDLWEEAEDDEYGEDWEDAPEEFYKCEEASALFALLYSFMYYVKHGGTDSEIMSKALKLMWKLADDNFSVYVGSLNTSKFYELIATDAKSAFGILCDMLVDGVSVFGLFDTEWLKERVVICSEN